MPRCLVIQHDPDGPSALAGVRLEHHGYELDVVQVMDEQGEPLPGLAFPDPLDYDFVLTLGSVQAVYDRDKIGSWIDDELDLLRRADAHGVPILGICFGGQALSAALGGTVEHAPYAEIGWAEVETEAPDVIAPGPWLVWHIDRFTVPPGATELARTALCPHAFRHGRSVGLQFHPEVDREMLTIWSAHPTDEYFASKGVSRDGLAADDARLATARSNLHTIVDWMVTEVAVSEPAAVLA